MVAGNGGFNVKSMLQPRGGVMPPDPTPGAKVDYLDTSSVLKTSGLTLDQYDAKHYGYLQITVDSKQLKLESHPVSPASPPANVDSVVVDIASHSVV